jgi:hypothetical protein
MHETLSSIRHEIRLPGTPVLERVRPLGGSSQIETIHARLDHGAIDDPCGDGRYVAGGHGHHDFVQQAHAPREVAARE